MRRRKDTFVKQDSVADIQELTTIAKNQKEYHEDRIRIIKRRIENINRQMLSVRDDFLSFLTSNGIDPNYPVMSLVTADQVVPSTVPEESMNSIAIEEAMLPNIPNTTFLTTINLLKNKYGTLQDEIEEYCDTLIKMRTKKSKLESSLESVQKSIEEYQDKIEENKEDYNDSVDNLMKIKSLYQNLLDFKYLFVVLPDTFTSESYIDFQNNYFDRYSTIYYEKKKTIKKYADKLQETYVPTAVDQMEQGFYMTVFGDISKYFGPYEEKNLQDKYVDAIPNKKDIIEKLDDLSISLNKLILNIKISIDTIRGVKGVGNSVVDGLVTSTNEIAKSFVAEKRIDHTTLESVSNNNYSINLGVNQNINEIRNKLQLGVENLDEKFMRASSKFLRKIALTFGFPQTFLYDRNTNIEDCVRNRVRQKYGGNIPFCDEEIKTDANGNTIFVKKSDIDSDTGDVKKDVQAKALEKMTRTDKSILSS